MTGETGARDKKESRMLAVVLIVLFLVLAIAAFMALPLLAEFNQMYLAPGVDLRDAAILAFIATLVVLVIFSIAAGDGLLGELQFMLLGFFAFYLVLWLLIAWVF